LYFGSNRMSQFPAALNAREDDIQKMLACQVHIGTRGLEPAMQRYVWKRRSDGIHLISLQKTWEKLVLAARVIVAIENSQDVCVISSRPYGQRAVFEIRKIHWGPSFWRKMDSRNVDESNSGQVYGASFVDCH